MNCPSRCGWWLNSPNLPSKRLAEHYYPLCAVMDIYGARYVDSGKQKNADDNFGKHPIRVFLWLLTLWRYLQLWQQLIIS